MKSAFTPFTGSQRFDILGVWVKASPFFAFTCFHLPKGDGLFKKDDRLFFKRGRIFLKRGGVLKKRLGVFVKPGESKNAASFT